MSAQKHIVIDARTIASSTGRYVHRLVDNLQDLDRINRYSILVRPTELTFWQPSAANFSLVEAPFADFSFGEQIGLKRLLDKLSPDLVHFIMPQHPVLYKGKFLVTIHDLTMRRFGHRSFKTSPFLRVLKQPVYDRVLKRAVQNSSGIITPTNFVKQDIASSYDVDESKLFVTYEAAEQLPSPAQKPQYNDYIMYVGHASDYKNLKLLIAAHQALIADHPKLWLILVGKLSNNHKKLQQWSQQQNFKQLRFTGFVNDRELHGFYKNTRAYVFPSLSEGFGLPGLEAMLHGAPVVSSNTTCLPEVYGNAAKYFNPLSVKDMAKSINDVISSKKASKDLVAAGKKQAQLYSWQQTAAETLAIYKQYL